MHLIWLIIIFFFQRHSKLHGEPPSRNSTVRSSVASEPQAESNPVVDTTSQAVESAVQEALSQLAHVSASNGQSLGSSYSSRSEPSAGSMSTEISAILSNLYSVSAQDFIPRFIEKLLELKRTTELQNINSWKLGWGDSWYSHIGKSGAGDSFEIRDYRQGSGRLLKILGLFMSQSNLLSSNLFM